MVSRRVALGIGLLVLAACEPTASRDGSEGGTGGAVPGQDASLEFDASSVPPALDAGATIVGGGAELGEELDFGSPGADLAACFDGVDNDGDGRFDCGDASCRAGVPACCVGVSEAPCCAAGASEMVPITSCTGALASCAPLLEEVEPFGAPGPNVIADEVLGAVLVAGGQSADSGLALRQVFDAASEALTLEASIAAPAAPHDRGADVLAFGLVDAEQPLGPSLTPLVALMVSGNRAQVILLVAGEVVQRWAVEPGLVTYGLALRPGGGIAVSRAGAELAAAELPVDRPVRPVVYGRTYNPAATDPAPVRMASLSVQRARCDIPSALSAPQPLFPPSEPTDPAWANVRRAAGPHVVRWSADGMGSRDWMALELDGAIHLAERGDTGWALTSPLDAPALRADGADWARDGLTDPALHVTDGGLELWVTGRTAGVGTVARVPASADGTFAWSDVEVVFAPDDGVRSYAQPAPYARGGATHVVMQVVRSSGQVALESRPVGGGSPDAVRLPSEDVFAFDRDEVAAPMVAQVGSTMRLFFAGRRGTRWSIGMLMWVEGLGWTEIGEPLVYTPTGSGFDALGALDPSVIVTGEALELVYTALDGAGTARVGVLRGAAPPVR